jgi:hypothetical protein
MTIKYNTDPAGNIKIITKDGKVSCGCCATPFGLLASATSAGGGQECDMGPSVQTFFIEPPYRLARNKQYKLRIVFSSGDSSYHVGSFYEAKYTLVPDLTIDWTTTFSGTFGDPWTISNGGKTIRFTLDDSEDCGGSNNQVQEGTAEAIIFNSTSSITMGFSFTGIAELEDSGFENISFFLEDVENT